MKILVTSLPDIQRIPVQRPHHLLLHLAERHEVSVRCVQSPREPPRQDAFIDNLMQKVDFRYLTEKSANPAIQELRSVLRRSLARELQEEGYDVHLNLNSLLAGPRIATLLSRSRVPTVFDVGDDLPAAFSESAQAPSWIRGLITPVSSLLLQHSLRSAAAVTYITEILARKYRFPGNKSAKVPNGVDCNLFHPAFDPRSREDLGIPADDFLCGMVGHLNSWVDLETPFHALRSLIRQGGRVKMLVVGGGEDLPYYQRIAAEMGIDGAVTFTGPTAYSMGPRLVQAMDLCMLCRRPTPASHASLPLKILEYMACAKPVLSTPLDGVRETVGDRMGYAATPAEFTAAITHLMEHRDAAAEAGEANREFVLRHHTWDLICNRFDQVIRGVISDAAFRQA
jgi:glycosyltransferase involved in cell wall biosynthesis